MYVLLRSEQWHTQALGGPGRRFKAHKWTEFAAPRGPQMTLLNIHVYNDSHKHGIGKAGNRQPGPR